MLKDVHVRSCLGIPLSRTNCIDFSQLSYYGYSYWEVLKAEVATCTCVLCHAAIFTTCSCSCLHYNSYNRSLQGE